MPGLQAKLCLENVHDSPLADLSEVIREPVTPLSWVLLNYILTNETASTDEWNNELLTSELDASPKRVRELESNGNEPGSVGAKESICGYLSSENLGISEIYAVDGDLHLMIEIGDREELRTLCADIEERYGPVTIDRITNVSKAEQTSEPVQVDLQELTGRQYEVLETAYRMGYFSYPREANAKDVADTLGITSSTVTEHLNSAQSKLFDEVFQQ